jgi:hypothetical protein
MTEFGGGSSKSHQEVPEASLVTQSPKRPWKTPRVIMPTAVYHTDKFRSPGDPLDSHENSDSASVGPPS